MAVSRVWETPIESATVLPAGGGFAVVRVAAGPGVESRSPLLCVEHERGMRRLLPIDPLDGHDPGEGSVDFLLPTVLLGLPLSLELGGEIHPLPRPDTAAGPAVDVTTAYLAQQEELVDLDARVTQLRAELRAASDRAAAAEDELASATDRFEAALIIQRREVGYVTDQLDDLRLKAAETEAALRNDLGAKDEEIVRLALQRSEIEAELEALRTASATELEALRTASATELEALRTSAATELEALHAETEAELDAAADREHAAKKEHTAALARAQAAADSAEARVAELSSERRRLEEQLSTLEEARAEVEGERTSALEDAERRLAEVSAERDELLSRAAALEIERDDLNQRLPAEPAEAADELNARIAVAEAERDAIDERRAQLASELAEARTMLTEEREAVERAYDRIATTIGERDELSGRVETLESEREGMLERQRAQGAASMQQLQTTLEEKRIELEGRIEAAEREARQRAAEAPRPAEAVVEAPVEAEAPAEPEVAEPDEDEVDTVETEAIVVEEVEAEPVDAEPAAAEPERATAEQEPAEVEVVAATAEAPAPAPEPADEAREDPTIISRLGLAALDLDGLAELYDIATRESNSSERRGKEAQVARWDALARAALAEAKRRPDPWRDAGDVPRAGRTGLRRFRRRRHAKLRQQLNAALFDRSS